VRRRIILGIAAFGLLYLYLIALVYAIGLVAAFPTPRWWIGTFSAHRGALLSWLLVSHLIAVVLVSLLFGWIIVRVYGRLSIPVSISFGLVIWAVFEAPISLDAFRSDGFFSWFCCCAACPLTIGWSDRGTRLR
jgi:hypothetical protein